ncbi:LPD29 domain-containing protein, partial [Citrobacter freundii]
AGEPSRIKIGTLKGTPDFFLDGSAAARGGGKNKFTICKYSLAESGLFCYNYYQKQGVKAQTDTRRNSGEVHKMSTIHKGALVVGQIVETGRNGRAVITRVHDRSNKDSVIELVGEGAIVRLGNAAFDLVYFSGERSRFVSECIIRGGLPWIVHTEVVTEAVLENLKKSADDKERQDAEAKAREDAAFALEKSRLQEAPEYKHLKKVADNKGKCEAATVSSNIRAELKKAFPGVKFSVKKLSFDCVQISWTDGPTKNEVEAISDKYEDGHFNGMEDIYEYNTSPFNVVYGGVKYVTTRRDYSNELVEKGIIQARKQFGNDLVPENCNAEMYQSGALSKLSREYFMYGFETELRKIIAGIKA